MKKRTLFILPYCRPGGACSSLASIYSGLDSEKYDISVFSMQDSLQNDKDSLSYKNTVLPADPLLAYYFGDYRKAPFFFRLFVIFLKVLSHLGLKVKNTVETIIEKRVVKQLESHYEFDTVVGFMEGFATKMASLFKTANKIAWVHCNYNTSVPLNISEELMYSRFNAIVCVSKFTTQVFRDRYPKLADRVQAIYNPQDTDNITRKAETQIENTAFLTDKFTIISIGRINHIKRFRDIPQIAYKIKQRHSDFRWYIFGAEQEEEEKSLLFQNIEKYGVDDVLQWMGYTTNPYPYLKASDLLVTTSISEACPMIFNEARALNVPIVSTDFPTSYEFIDNGVTGVISPIETISESIIRMMDDNCFYQTIKENSQKVIIDSTTIIESIESLL